VYFAVIGELRRMTVGRSKLKMLLKAALVRTGALRLAATMTQPAAAILMYHSVVEEPESTRTTIRISRSRHDFELHMRALAERFTPVTIEEVVQFAQAGRLLPPRAVAVSFDDGFADNYEEALPVLARYGIPAAFYILVNAVETGSLPWYCRLNFAFNSTRRTEWVNPEQNHVCSIQTARERKAALSLAWDAGASKTGEAQQAFVRQIERSLDVEPPGPGLMLTRDQVRALRKAGHIVGAHTLSHPNLAHVSEAEARSEICGSKRRLEEILGEPVHHFSYPHPALDPCWTAQTVQMTREAGFRSAVLTDCGSVRRWDEPLTLKRLHTAGDLQQWTWNLECTLVGRRV
jgi:peptidoglycan/xylan/chitin deacetylase (PgdA/CDA1 family)